MARIDGEIVIGRPVDVVFDCVSHQSNGPQCNPRMVRAEKMTAWPVGKGTRFRSAVASMWRTAEMLNINLNDEDLVEARQRICQYMDAFGRGRHPYHPEPWISGSREAPECRSGRSQS